MSDTTQPSSRVTSSPPPSTSTKSNKRARASSSPDPSGDPNEATRTSSNKRARTSSSLLLSGGTGQKAYNSIERVKDHIREKHNKTIDDFERQISAMDLIRGKIEGFTEALDRCKEEYGKLLDEHDYVEIYDEAAQDIYEAMQDTSEAIDELVEKAKGSLSGMTRSVRRDEDRG